MRQNFEEFPARVREGNRSYYLDDERERIKKEKELQKKRQEVVYSSEEDDETSFNEEREEEPSQLEGDLMARLSPDEPQFQLDEDSEGRESEDKENNDPQQFLHPKDN